MAQVTFNKLADTDERNEIIFSTDANLPSIQNTVTYDSLIIKGGSIAFKSSPSTTYFTIANDTDLSIGTSAFTIEWFQYWVAADSGSFPRPFSIGTWPSASIGVSYEGVDFYVWVNGTGNPVGAPPAKNTWVHIALVGNPGTNIKVYRNGTLLSTITGSYNFTNSSTALTIGNETSNSTSAQFGGRITNFRWVKGTQVYTSNFTVPNTPLTNISGTELLLLASSSTTFTQDSSSRARTVTNTGGTYNTTTPF